MQELLQLYDTAIVNKILPDIALDTVIFIFCMDSLFDMFNSDSLKHPKRYKQAFVNADYQLGFLFLVKQYLLSFKLFSSITGKDVSNLVKCFKCWIYNINCLVQLWNYLSKNRDIKYLLIRRFCTDSIEHFFLNCGLFVVMHLILHQFSAIMHSENYS